VVLAAALLVALSSMLVRDGTGAVFGREPRNGAELVLMRGLAGIFALAFAVAAALIPAPADVIFVVSLSLAAAGLLPALILALWVPRATATGCVVGVVSGLVLGTYYLAGTALYSVAFYEAWAGFSNAGPQAFAEYQEARELWVAADGDDRAAAYADLAARTSGSLWSPGLANWFGIAPAASPVLAVPLALLIGVIVSFVDQGRGRSATLDPGRMSADGVSS